MMKSISLILFFAAAAFIAGCNDPDSAKPEDGRSIRLLEEENHRQAQVIVDCRQQIETLRGRITLLEAEKNQTEQDANDSISFLMGLIAQKDAELVRCTQQLEELSK